MNQEHSEQEAALDEAEQTYETTADEVTGFGPGRFNRKRVMMAICVSFAVVVGGGLIFNVNSGGQRQRSADPDPRGRGASPPQGFLQTQLNRSVASLERQAAQERAAAATDGEPIVAAPPSEELPAVAWNDSPAARFVPPPPQQQPAHAPPPPPPGHGGAAPPPRPTHYSSPLVPRIEGRLIASGNSPAANSPAGNFPVSPNSPVAHNSPWPGNPQGTFNSPAQVQHNAFGGNPVQHMAGGQAGFFTDGHFIADNSLWIGTVIPAVLTTAINTDLPGNILARVTENVFDSRTGSRLLIPQGSILFARYNSAVSYAQRRVQIAWDTLIRPDGFQLNLGGMDGVDRRGMAGQEAAYSGNWFRYLQAAGLIAMFSIANASMAEEAARHTSEAVAGSIAQANAEFVSQVGGNIVSRAMDIQPTLTVDSGTTVNVMVNRNLALPPLDAFPVTQRHRLNGVAP
ncbi:MAG: TrbI/VirB10 family protein [Treponema sp.]|nr:TrbI/VirB10 family protein [Treponema sp.]